MKALLQRVSFFALTLLVTCYTGVAATYTLTINTNGNGTVGRNPTNSVYPTGSVVTLTALPASGWSFSSWSGDASGTNNPLNVTMDANKVITANFSQIPSYTLTVNISGDGSVNPPGGSFLSNTIVSLTATPSNGWVFGSWSGAASGNANPLNLTMDGHKSITATFGQPPFITVQPQSTNVSPGATVTLNVGAAGSAPLLYQWQSFGGPLTDQTNASLVLTNVQAGGDYRVRVSNTYGAATSQVAVLTVECAGTNVVSTCTDSALRQAMSLGGLVRLCCNGTIVLTNTIAVTKDTTLDASGNSTVISGNNAVRLFNVSTGVTFIMTNVVLAGGRLVGANGTNAGPAPFQPAEPGHAADGAAIYNDGGMVRLIRSVLRDHALIGGTGGSGTGFTTFYGAEGGSARGAALFNNLGTVELIACLVTNNSAVGGNGGTSSGSAANGGVGGTAFGGAIFNNGGTLRVSSSLAISNSAIGGQGGGGPAPYRGGDARGGAICSSSGELTMTNCTVMGNSAFVVAGPPTPQGTNAALAQGGAIFEVGGTMILDSSDVRNNVARGGDSPFGGAYQTRPGNAAGGAVYVQGGAFSIARCTITTNQAIGGTAYRHSGTGEASGGAVYNRGTLRVADTRIAMNHALAGSGSSVNASAFGGGFFNVATAILERALFDNNVARGGSAGSFGTISAAYPGGDALGGAIFNLGLLSATNCTLALNQSQAGGASGFDPSVVGGIAYGGGFHNAGGTAQLMNVTVATNAAIPGIRTPALCGANIASTNGALILRNSLVAYPSASANSWGTINDGGFNISSDGSANFSSGTSFNFTDPKLLPLANNGGLTLTMALASDSPAIDWAPVADAPATDQRGFHRPYGAGADLGALEASPPIPPLVGRRDGGVLNLSFSGQTGFSYRIERSTDLLTWELQEVTGILPANGVVLRMVPMTGPKQFFRLSLDF